MKKKKKLETSKLVLWIVLIITLILVIAVLYAGFFLGFIEVAATLGVIMAPAVTVIGFYSNKAKAENRLKILLEAKKKGIDEDSLINSIDSDE